jgi:hypothetical protein
VEHTVAHRPSFGGGLPSFDAWSSAGFADAAVGSELTLGAWSFLSQAGSIVSMHETIERVEDFVIHDNVQEHR